MRYNRLEHAAHVLRQHGIAALDPGCDPGGTHQRLHAARAYATAHETRRVDSLDVQASRRRVANGFAQGKDVASQGIAGVHLFL